MLAGAFAGLFAAANAHAVVVSIDPANVGISSMTYSVMGSTIVIDEIWGNAGPGFLRFDQLDNGTNYTVVKNITNNTGIDWTRLANELLDPAGQAEDNADPMPYPAFVPAGFSTSNDNDGLSFAQGSGIARASDVWSTVFADELTDVRDFLDYFNGTLADGATGFIEFGLRDNGSGNEPFLLSQRPNVASRPVPEPASIFLIGVGLLGLSALARRR